MLRIPTSSYSEPLGSTRYLDVIVDLTDEGRPRLSIELGQTELVHRIPDLEEPEFVGAADAMAHDDARDQRIAVLEEQNAELRLYRETLEAHAADLRRRLEAARERSIDRDLDPDEARCIATALRHYADEADSFGRRT